jgi:hypothetical protein
MTALIFLGKPLPTWRSLPPDLSSLLTDDPRRNLRRFPPDTPLRERILLRFVVKSSGCWEYSKSKHSAGYGVIRCEGVIEYVHRVSYSEFVGPLIEDMTVDHLCHNRPCGNPFHLQQVTNLESILRGTGASATNARKTHCAAGHELQYRKPGQRWCKICNDTDRGIDRANLRRGTKTHCLYGHEWTPENTYWRPDGKGRQCRICIRQRSLA